MYYFLRFYHETWLYFLIPAIIIAIILRLKCTKRVFYKYSLGKIINKNGFASKHKYKAILSFMRFFTIFTLALLVARPQLVDNRSTVFVEGVDMIVVLDVSGSMNLQDFDNESRFDVAKKEALRFVEKREHDPIGLVIFGNTAISRCPITLDKNILNKIIADTNVGVVDPNGTVLSRALLIAQNRLKDSSSKSKIIILLTDGEPTENDVSSSFAIEVAQKMGIKIYTIGIGSEEQQYFRHPFYGIMPMPKVNSELLKNIADSTGGKFFMAKNKKDMRNIYDTIDKLEKTEYKTNIYNRYFDIFMPFLWAAFIILFLEIFLSLFVWFGF